MSLNEDYDTGYFGKFNVTLKMHKSHIAWKICLNAFIFLAKPKCHGMAICSAFQCLVGYFRSSHNKQVSLKKCSLLTPEDLLIHTEGNPPEVQAVVPVKLTVPEVPDVGTIRLCQVHPKCYRRMWPSLVAIISSSLMLTTSVIPPGTGTCVDK